MNRKAYAFRFFLYSLIIIQRGRNNGRDLHVSLPCAPNLYSAGSFLKAGVIFNEIETGMKLIYKKSRI
ncbi:hypothetical protein AAV35_013215 [Salimicrobium jeotgali]|uniref:Uncharacterized protein n=1 Tax=Salimicrobium jeotgali TaxID=1230341 RepID=K2G7K8_9BACI|nr:hypothetical protein AAV35_013215 [Salimicrobium jeotgali]EKE30382.1 hypothetical protein MJ3_13114 [Salimicrobium jeotgali]